MATCCAHTSTRSAALSRARSRTPLGLYPGSPSPFAAAGRWHPTSSRVAPWPAAVRWLTNIDAGRIGLRPKLPAGATGCLCFLFDAPGEADPHACQCEAVDAGGARVLFHGAAKRPSVRGSDFAAGRRMFVARGGGGVHLCEGPLDALALLQLQRLGLVDLADATVLAAAGAGLFTPSAVAGYAGRS